MTKEIYLEKGKKIWRKLKAVSIYSILFSAIALYLVMLFKKYDKSFIWSFDGLDQHIVNLRQFRLLIVDFFRTGQFSTFFWNVEFGIDLFANFAYYIFGDFFSYISVLVSTAKVEALYSILVIVRMYFVGISFLCYCKHKKMQDFPSILGALMYTFCSYVLFTAVRHPYFINAIILFPLMMIGTEKIILENKSVFYTIVIAITFIANFYFAYMIAFIIAIYGLILTIYTYKSQGIKKIAQVLFKVLFYSILGIMMSAVILFPTAIEFLNSERTASNGIYPYTIVYYRNLMNNLLSVSSAGYWVFCGVQSIAMLAIPLLIRRRKENYPIFLLMLILIIPLLISQVGSILVGFNYPNNRWSFILSFIFSYATVVLLHNCKIEKKDWQAIAIFALLYFGINSIFEINMKFYTQIQIFIAIFILLLIINKEKIKWYKTLLMGVFILGIVSSIENFYSIDGINYASEFLKENDLQKAVETSNYSINDFKNAIDTINHTDSGFYRVMKYPYQFDNVSVLKKHNVLGGYYSIIPKDYQELSTDLVNLQYALNRGTREFDYRTKITTLLGVKYYISNGKNTVPYGYSLKENYKGNSKLYENQYALPFGILYTKYISLQEYEKLNPLEKESSLLKTTAIKEEEIEHKDLLSNGKIEYNHVKEIDYDVIDNNDIELENNIVIKDAKKNSIKLNIQEVLNSEIYVYVEGLNYEPFSKEQLMELNINEKTTRIQKEKLKEQYKWYEPDYFYRLNVNFQNIEKSSEVYNYKTSPYYIEKKEMLFNLGYYNKGLR